MSLCPCISLNGILIISKPPPHNLPTPDTEPTSIWDLVKVFSWIGLTGFGGPAAHLAMMEEEFVQRRRWISPEEFIDFVGATNLIPGPNAPEVAAHIGERRAGWRGMLACGISFITPGIILTLILAWAYVRYGTMPQAEALLGGIKPVVLAVVAMATYRLGRVAVRGLPCFVLAGVSLALGMFGVDEIPLLFGMGIAGMLLLRLLDASSPPDDKTPPILKVISEPGTDCVSPEATLSSRNDDSSNKLSIWFTAAAAWAGLSRSALAATATAAAVGAAGVVAAQHTMPTLLTLGLFFAKIGSVLYGSGYVLIAFIEGGLVNDLHWLTRRELLDSIAVGQLTPGPLTTSATFIGYYLLGWKGAAVATIGMFAPAFAFVAVLSRVLPRLRKSVWAGAFLDAVNAVSIALMAEVVLSLGFEMLNSPFTWLLAIAALVAGLRWKVATPWLMLAGALAGAGQYLVLR